MDARVPLVIFQDNFMEAPRLVKRVMNVPRQGDEVIINSNVFIVTRVRTRYASETAMPTALVDMERVRSTDSNDW